ncbi:hypothetical protein GQ53DRAFT_816462 [Thozetella sp. PMI_491]|nr:hypothetical protein GQ53DRAFT_816462 [Thozetella sp. PMI_491]
MEGKDDPSGGHTPVGETSLAASLPAMAGATRGTPPAQRFANLGDAHLAITAGRHLASGGGTSVALTDDSREANDMPNSSSGFNPALATGGDANLDETEDTTVARIVGQYLPSASSTNEQTSATVSDNATSSSGFNLALAQQTVLSDCIVAALSGTDTVAEDVHHIRENSLFGREGAITRIGFRHENESIYDDAVFPAGLDLSNVYHGPLSLPNPPEFPLPTLPEYVDQVGFNHNDDLVSVPQSTSSIIDTQELLMSVHSGQHVGHSALVGLDDSHEAHDSLAVPPLNLRAMHDEPELPASFHPEPDVNPFLEQHSGGNVEQTSTSGISGSDSQHNPFEYDDPPYRCFLRRSNELNVSQHLHHQTLDSMSNVSQAVHHNADGTALPYLEEPHPNMPPLPPVPYLPMRDPGRLTRRATTTSTWDTQLDATPVRVPIQNMRGYSEHMDGVNYIREQIAMQDEHHMLPNSRGFASDGDEWVTEATTGGFNSHRAFASSDIQSPLTRIGCPVGSSLADTSDPGYNDEFDLPIGAHPGFPSNERILPTPPLAHCRGRSRGQTLRDTGRDVVFEARPRLHRVNGCLQDSFRNFQIGTPRDSGPFGAASRAFTSGLSSNPYLNLERSNRFDFRDDESGTFGNEHDETTPTDAKPPQQTTRDSRYAVLNCPASESGKDAASMDSVDRENSARRKYSIVHSGPQSPVYLECPLIDREEFARRQAVRRASGEEDQTFLDSTGKKLSNPSSAILRQRHQDVQNPFESADSLRSQPANAHRIHSIEMEPLTRQGRCAYQYPSQIRAGPLPYMVPLDERRRWANHGAPYERSPNCTLNVHNGMPLWVVSKHHQWFVMMIIGSMAIPFFWTLIYTRIHNSALSWFTEGHVTELSVTERMAVGICGVIGLLIWVIVAGVLALMAHDGILH